jgi:hypothetical protein
MMYFGYEVDIGGAVRSCSSERSGDCAVVYVVCSATDLDWVSNGVGARLPGSGLSSAQQVARYWTTISTCLLASIM